jgi:YgiT-type zinc finger domain-containing protein
MEKCPMCWKGVLERKEVDVTRHGLFAGHFRALVCSKCGEQIFEEKIKK